MPACRRETCVAPAPKNMAQRSPERDIAPLYLNDKSKFPAFSLFGVSRLWISSSFLAGYSDFRAMCFHTELNFNEVNLLLAHQYFCCVNFMVAHYSNVINAHNVTSDQINKIKKNQLKNYGFMIHAHTHIFKIQLAKYFQLVQYTNITNIIYFRNK